jgi:hypothetical protein
MIKTGIRGGDFTLSSLNESINVFLVLYEEEFNMANCDYVRYESRDGVGMLYIRKHGYWRQKVCKITDDQWNQIVEFVSNWKYKDRFVRINK